jgi:hypothetical protein
VGNTTGNVLKFNPATAVLISSAQKGTDLTAKLLRSAKAGALTLKLIDQALDQTAMEVLLDNAADRNAVALAVKTLYGLAKDIGSLKQMPADYASYRAELLSQIENIDRSMRSAQEKLASSVAWKQFRDNLLKSLEESCKTEMQKPIRQKLSQGLQPCSGA